MRCDTRDAMREPMRCELVAMQCAALRCTVRGLFAMRCARAGCIRAVRCDARDAQADALRGRCTGCDARTAEGDARADALRTGCDAMRCARAGCIRAVQAAPCF